MIASKVINEWIKNITVPDVLIGKRMAQSQTQTKVQGPGSC